MTPHERAQKIESYGNAHTLLVDALNEFPKEMWQFRDEHGCWSIHEHIIHITDSEANSYIRCRRLIAEQGESLMAYDENLWASELNYPHPEHRRRPCPLQAAAPQELHAHQDAPRTRLGALLISPRKRRNYPRRLARHLRAPPPQTHRIHAPEPRGLAEITAFLIASQ